MLQQQNTSLWEAVAAAGGSGDSGYSCQQEQDIGAGGAGGAGDSGQQEQDIQQEHEAQPAKRLRTTMFLASDSPVVTDADAPDKMEMESESECMNTPLA